jgi:hypothetical protein
LEDAGLTDLTEEQKVRAGCSIGSGIGGLPGIESEALLLKTVEALNTHYVYPRRYFFPSLNKLNYVDQRPCPVSEDISTRVLCLPLFHQLSKPEQELICRVILRAARYDQ